MEAALYGEGGFFTGARGAGRGGRDFVTSPEVGTLFGALIARALDGWWDDLGTPDPFLVVEAGAGRGRLAADVLAAAPRCAPALRYVLVERSDELRAAQRDLLVLEPVEDALGPVRPGGDEDDGEPRAVAGLGPIATQLAELPAVQLDGVVLANELLDNLPFRLVERGADGWAEVRVAFDGEDFVETVVPASPELATEADRVVATCAVGTRLPVPTGCREWLRACAVDPRSRSTGRRRLRGHRGRTGRASCRRLAADLPRAPARRAPTRRSRSARTSPPTSRSSTSSTRRSGPASCSNSTLRRPTGCATSGSTRSSTTRVPVGTLARTSATSKR